MRHKQFIALLMSVCLMVPATTVSATEMSETMQNMENSLNSSENKSDFTSSGISATSGSFDLSGADLDGVFADMASALQNGTSLTLSQAINNNSNFNISSDSLYDLSDINLISSTMNSLDAGVINTEYQNLASSLSSSYANTDLSGNSANCMELFNSTYGGIAEQLTLENPEIPEGFTVSNMINSASDIVNSAYSDTSNSGTFSSVKGSVSIGKIFSVANSGLSMASLASESEMRGLISDIDASNYSSAMSSYQNATSSAASNLKNSSDLYSQASSNLLNVVDMSGAMLNLDGSVNKKNIKKKIKSADSILDSAVGSKYDTKGEKIVDTAKSVVKTIGNGVLSISKWIGDVWQKAKDTQKEAGYDDATTTPRTPAMGQ